MGELCSKLRLKVIRNSTKSNYMKKCNLYCNLGMVVIYKKQTNKQKTSILFLETLLHNNMVDENFGTDYLDNCGKVL